MATAPQGNWYGHHRRMTLLSPKQNKWESVKISQRGTQISEKFTLFIDRTTTHDRVLFLFLRTSDVK